MRFPGWTTRSLFVLMASVAVLLGAEVSAIPPDALPGNALSLWRAKEEASFIVVAEVGKTGDVLDFRKADDGAGAYMLWTELKPSAVLKGRVSEEDLNKRPLSIRIRGEERFPKSGEEFIVFIGDASSRGPITKMLANTKENRAAIDAAKPEPEPREKAADLYQGGGIGGLGGGGLGGGLGSVLGRVGSPPKPPSPPSYQGTKIVPDKGATGDMLKVQSEFAAAMSREDPKSEDREAHFSWLDRNEYVRRYDVRRIGWYGGVLGCGPRPEGGWFVKVVVRPWLHSMYGMRHTIVIDTVEETYEFVGGQARMIESNAAIAKPGRQCFPIAW